jgi:hypothetical protein
LRSGIFVDVEDTLVIDHTIVIIRDVLIGVVLEGMITIVIVI